jgi:hypothetical protein
MSRSARTEIDPEFWNRLREELRSYMTATGLNQRELAPKLGINPTTLNNFLNRQTKALGGLAVALACTIVELHCDGTRIGRILPSRRTAPHAEPEGGQLVLEFDGTFEIKGESRYPTIVLRKPSARRANLRLAIKNVG